MNTTLESSRPLPPVRVGSSLQTRFERQRAAALAMPDPPLALRQDRLSRLEAMTIRFEHDFIEAIDADFGQRCAQVTQIADVMMVRAAIRHARNQLADWMRVRRSTPALALFPGRNELRMQALGVVGIISPWNYPFQLAMVPAVSALAAGNRVMVKPSEATPHFSALLEHAVHAYFSDEEMCVLCGDARVGQAFAALPFDHLLFTGSTATGRQVARAAASNLTPVTLELGGKSPAILNADCDLAEASLRLMSGKLFNAGQTCIAPDYLLVPPSLMAELPAALRGAAETLYPSIAGNPDYTSLINDHHLARVQAMVDDAEARGARLEPLHRETATVGRCMPPVLALEMNEQMRLMQEEVFAPVLPVIVYADLDDAVNYVNRRDRPLALYWFGRSKADRRKVLQRTVAGGVTINDCLLHAAQDGLPFGGVGASGHGKYHGVHGFRTFSHEKPVFLQSRRSGTGLMAPPYGPTFDRLKRLVGRLM